MTPYHGLLLLTAIWIVWIIAEWWGRNWKEMDDVALEEKTSPDCDPGPAIVARMGRGEGSNASNES